MEEIHDSQGDRSSKGPDGFSAERFFNALNIEPPTGEDASVLLEYFENWKLRAIWGSASYAQLIMLNFAYGDVGTGLALTKALAQHDRLSGGQLNLLHAVSHALP